MFMLHDLQATTKRCRWLAGFQSMMGIPHQ